MLIVDRIQHYIGPDVELRTLGFICSEAYLAFAYDHRDPSLYKVVGSDDIIKFLPIDAPEESKHVTQTVLVFHCSLQLDDLMLCFKWNIEVGRKYEVVLTMGDGLCRYHLGDVVEAVGFDPHDGQLIIHYLEVRL